MNFNPDWIEASADALKALENGLAMMGRNKDNSAPAIVQPVVSKEAMLWSAAILALAILLGAAIIHHGLVA